MIAFVTEAVSVKAFLKRLGVPTEPRAVMRARGPCLEDFNLHQRLKLELGAPQPIPDYEFNQRVSW